LGPGPESEVRTQHLPLMVGALFPSRVGAQTSVGLSIEMEGWLHDGGLSSAFGDRDDFMFDLLLTWGIKAELFCSQKQCWLKGT
jgi:hypothetical protein